MSDNKTVYAHLPSTSLLGILFVGLKLGHIIDWSWWWVTCPFWAPWVITLGILGVVALVAGLIALLGK